MTSKSTHQLALKFISPNEWNYDIPLSVRNEIRSKLLHWYHNNRRQLPWRGDKVKPEAIHFTKFAPPEKFSMINDYDGVKSVYGIWVSEIMCQQTRIETVLPYWIRWMERFPTIDELSHASPEEVNKYWSGLGYYRRAQQLLSGAKLIMEKYNGVIPNDKSTLRKIPGIGPYTAGAILSIAFNQVEPLVDGNVIRLLSRLLAIHNHDVGSKAMEQLCWDSASQLLDPSQPGDFNQGLMELGATVCKPTNPDCQQCPLHELCHANALVKYHKQIELQYENINKTDDNLNTKLKSMKKSHHSVNKPDQPLNIRSFFKTKSSHSHPTDHKIIELLDDDVSAECPVEMSHVERQQLFNLLPKDVTEFPKKCPKKKPVDYYLQVLVLFDPTGQRYLFMKRPNQGLLANQWEFPNAPMIHPLQSFTEHPEDKSFQSFQVDSNGNGLLLFDTKIGNEMESSFSQHLKEKLGFAIKFYETHATISEEKHFVHDLDNMFVVSKLKVLSAPITHVFSHQRHIMVISFATIQSSTNLQTSRQTPVTSDNAVNINASNKRKRATPIKPSNDHSSLDDREVVESRWMTKEEIIHNGITSGCKKILEVINKYQNIF